MFLNGFIKKLKCGFWSSLADLLKHVANSRRSSCQKQALSVPSIIACSKQKQLTLMLHLFFSVKDFSSIITKNGHNRKYSL